MGSLERSRRGRLGPNNNVPKDRPRHIPGTHQFTHRFCTRCREIWPPLLSILDWNFSGSYFHTRIVRSSPRTQRDAVNISTHIESESLLAIFNHQKCCGCDSVNLEIGGTWTAVSRMGMLYTINYIMMSVSAPKIDNQTESVKWRRHRSEVGRWTFHF